MLTGDRDSAAKAVAQKLGIDEVHSQLLPNEKVEALEKILLQKDPNKMVGFVGDGINDAPVLTRADVGISMGALGADAAIEASDVVLMDDNLLKIVKAIKISKKCIGIVKQNIAFAIGVKVLWLILTAVGLASMWLGIFADVGVMIIAVINARSGNVTLGDLADYVKTNVSQKSIVVNNKSQTPTISSSAQMQNVWRTMKLFRK